METDTPPASRKIRRGFCLPSGEQINPLERPAKQGISFYLLLLGVNKCDTIQTMDDGYFEQKKKKRGRFMMPNEQSIAHFSNKILF